MVISFPSLQISPGALVCDLEKQHAWGLWLSLQRAGPECKEQVKMWQCWLLLCTPCRLELWPGSWTLLQAQSVHEEHMGRGDASQELWISLAHGVTWRIWGQPGKLWGGGVWCWLCWAGDPKENLWGGLGNVILLWNLSHSTARPWASHLGKWCKSGPGEGALPDLVEHTKHSCSKAWHWTSIHTFYPLTGIVEVFTQGHPSFPKINLGLIIDSFASESCETRGFQLRGNVGGSCYDFKFTWIRNSGWDLGRGGLNTDGFTGKNTFKLTLVKCNCQWLRQKPSLKTLKQIKTHYSLLKSDS